MRIPFGKPFPAIDSVSLRNGVAAGLVNGYINELDDYHMVPGHTLFGTHADAQPVAVDYETLAGVPVGVTNGKVVKLNSNGTFTEFTGDTVTANAFYSWAEDGQHVYLAHGGKLARLDMTNLTVTLMNENTPSNVTHIVRSKGFLLCNGTDQIFASTSFDLAQIFDTNTLSGAVTLTDRDGWILVCGGIAAIPGKGRIYLSKDNGLSWTKTYEASGLAGNEAVLSLCYMGSGVVLAGTTGYDDGIIINHGTVLRSTDYGQTWADLGVLTGNVTIPIIAKIDTNIAIAGGTDLYRSIDNGLTWAAIPTANFSNTVRTCLVWSTTVVFVGVASAGNVAHLWKSVDAGVTFTDTTTLDAAASVCSSVKVSATIGLIGVQIIAGVSKIYRTTDAGTTWSDIGVIGLEDGMAPIAFLLSSTGDLLFIASGNVQASQLWKSTDDGVIWKQLCEMDIGTGDGSTINGLIETHADGEVLAVGRLSFPDPTGADTAAKWQTGINRNAPQGDVFYSEDITNNYEAIDSWERFNAQSVPDAVTGVFENRGLVYTAGPRSVEVNYNSTEPAFPWQVSDPSLPYGLGSPFSWVNYDDLNAVMYLSCTDKIWEVVKFQGRVQQSISQVYSAILNDRTLITSPETAKAWGVTMRGIPMYVLTFQDDNLTICYNLLKDHWFRWGYWNGSTYEAAIINSYCYSRTLNKHLVGDRRNNGRIYELTGLSNNGDAIRFELTSGHVGDWSVVTAGRMTFKCKRGAAIDSSEPTFTWQNRDNGNQNFSTGRTVSLGLTSDTELLGVLNRNGVYQLRQHRIVYDGTKTDFIFAGADES